MRKLCRMIFSRYAVSFIIILLEIAFYVLLVFRFSFLSLPAFAFLTLLNVLSAIVVINRDSHPEYKASWLAAIVALPYLGLVLYLLFYSRSASKKHLLYIEKINKNLTEDKREMKNSEVLERLDTLDSLASGKARAIMNDDGLAKIYGESNSTFFKSGEDMFESMLSDLREAKDYVFLEYFIIDLGYMWDSIHEILVEKAKEGVEVRVMYDDIGSWKSLPARYPKKLIEEGIKCVRFGRVNPKISTIHNNRNHRKILVIDGKVAYTGGINVADEYINKRKRLGYWKDGGVRIVGRAVEGFLRLFISTWDFTTKSFSDYERYAKTVIPSESDGGFYIPFGSGPAPIYTRPVGKNAFLNVINQAKKYLYITSPYLVIDYDLTESLRNAALRGVDVRIITPAIADKKFVKVMTKSAYPHLMEAGVKIYEYTPGFIHEKTLVSDDKYAVIGTINLDYRSFVHHYENAVWLYGSPTVITAKEEFLKSSEESLLMDSDNVRLTLKEKIIRTAIKIGAPLL